MTLSSEQFRLKKWKKRLRREAILESRMRTYGSKSLPTVFHNTKISDTWKEVKISSKKNLLNRLEDWLKKKYV